MLKSGVAHIGLLLVYSVFFIILLRKNTSFIKHLVYFLFFIYINGVVAVTLFPVPVQKELVEVMARDDFLKNSFMPLKDIIDILENQSINVIIKQIIGNIVMFVPLGVFIPLIFINADTFKKMFVIGLLSSLLIESLQSFISLVIGVQYKITSTDDVILNTLGALVGFVIFKIALKLVGNRFTEVDN